MPTYEYACTECGLRFEVVQRIADDSLVACEVCGGRLRKLFHPAGIVLKGSGFYKTDNRPKQTSSSEERKPSEKQGGKGSGGGAKPKEKSA